MASLGNKTVKQGYSFYIATVVIIGARLGLRIEARLNKSRPKLYKQLLSL